jgi:hypothetical protein
MMRRPNETLHYGLDEYASMAARCRSVGLYSTGAQIEDMFGERRDWDAIGRTMYAAFPASWLADQDRRCWSLHLEQAHTSPITNYATGGNND